MKKKQISILCLILTLIMVLSLTACSGGDKQKLIGAWKCVVDMTDLINEELSSEEEIGDVVSVEDFKIEIFLEFCSDDTFSMWADEDSVDKAMDGMIEDVSDDLIVYLENMVAEQTGGEMSVEEVLELSGTTMDELLAEAFPEDEIEKLKDDASEAFTQEGKFKVEDGKLYTSAGTEYDVDPQEYETYTLEGSTLTIDGFNGDIDDFFVEGIYPLTFKKQ